MPAESATNGVIHAARSKPVEGGAISTRSPYTFVNAAMISGAE